VKVVSLASGSAGNAYLVGAAGAWLMIDCGLGPRELKSRLASVGLADDLPFAGLLVTHNHIDHVAGVEAFHRHHPDVPIFANLMTAEATATRVKMEPDAFTCFENGQDFEVGPFAVHPFSIPHDTCDPVGYQVCAEGLTYFHGTDIGTPLASVGLRLREADIATLESNHDAVMLRTSPRAASLKQRIAGPRGHLSNDESAELVRRYAAPKLKALALAHLSRECNTPRFAEETMRAALAEMARTDIRLMVLSQEEGAVVWAGSDPL